MLQSEYSDILIIGWVYGHMQTIGRQKLP